MSNLYEIHSNLLFSSNYLQRKSLDMNRYKIYQQKYDLISTALTQYSRQRRKS